MTSGRPIQSQPLQYPPGAPLDFVSCTSKVVPTSIEQLRHNTTSFQPGLPVQSALLGDSDTQHPRVQQQRLTCFRRLKVPVCSI